MELELTSDHEADDAVLNSVAQVIFRNFPRVRWLQTDTNSSENVSLPGTESFRDLTSLYVWRMAADVGRNFRIGPVTRIRYVIEDANHQIVLIGVESEEIEQACFGPLVYVRTLHLYDVYGKEALRFKPVTKRRISRVCSPIACCCFAVLARRGMALEVLAISAQLTGSIDNAQVVRIRQAGSCFHPRFEVEMFLDLDLDAQSDTGTETGTEAAEARKSVRMRVRSGGLLCNTVPEWRRKASFSVELLCDDGSSQSGTIVFARIPESKVDLDVPSLRERSLDADVDAERGRRSGKRMGSRRRTSAGPEEASTSGSGGGGDESEDGSIAEVEALRLRLERPGQQGDPLLRDCPEAAFVINASGFTAATRSRVLVSLLGVAYAIDTMLIRRSDSEFD